LFDFVVFDVATFGETCHQHGRVVLILGSDFEVGSGGAEDAYKIDTGQSVVLFPHMGFQDQLFVPEMVLRIEGGA
jgi:hypothetical protein